MKKKRHRYYKQPSRHGSMWVSKQAMAWVVAAMGGLLLLFVVVKCLQFVMYSDQFQLRQVEIDGTLPQVDRHQFEQTIRDHLTGNFFTISLNRLSHSLVSLPWVDTVTTRRVWPGTLRVSVQQQQPMARWGAEHLLNQQGKVLPLYGVVGDSLPMLSGPVGSSKVVYSMYQSLSHQLSTLHLFMMSLQLTNGGDWEVKLDNQMTVIFSSGDTDQKIHQFLAFYPQLLSEKKQPIELIDMRYPNGFAVRRSE